MGFIAFFLASTTRPAWHPCPRRPQIRFWLRIFAPHLPHVGRFAHGVRLGSPLPAKLRALCRANIRTDKGPDLHWSRRLAALSADFGVRRTARTETAAPRPQTSPTRPDAGGVSRCPRVRLLVCRRGCCHGGRGMPPDLCVLVHSTGGSRQRLRGGVPGASGEPRSCPRYFEPLKSQSQKSHRHFLRDIINLNSHAPRDTTK